MPKSSKKRRLIRELKEVLATRLEARQLRAALDEEDPHEDNLDLAT